MSLAVLRAFRMMELRPDNQWMRGDPVACAEIEANIMNGPAIALPSSDNPAVICGVAHCYGIGTVWMIAGSEFEKCWRKIFSIQRTLLQSAFDALHLRRMHILVDAGNQTNRRYAEHLGFKQETEQAHCGLGPRGEDLLFYIWRKED